MPTKLERLMAKAIADQRESSNFFQALMEASVYAHIPLEDRIGDDVDRIRFVQFHRPDNDQLTLPFFTDEAKAQAATGASVQVIEMIGRDFFELTLGATLMMDPNDWSCTLYPEEVEALLRTGRVATIETFVVKEKAEPLVGPPQGHPARLIDELTRTLATLPFIQTAYLAGVYNRTDVPEQTGFILALGGDPKQAERATHAIATALQLTCTGHSNLPVDVGYFDIRGDAPSWVTGLGLQSFYDRRWGARLFPTSGIPKI